MTDANQSGRNEDVDVESYYRRLKAAGITDDMPNNADEFRDKLARQLAMLTNNWRGCRELICRRNRGCMAPNIVCSNNVVLPEEEEDRLWREVHADIVFAIKACVAELGIEDD